MTSSDFSDRVRNYPSARHGPLAHREKYRPGQLEKINDRKAAFDRLYRFIMARGGWITSIPGDRLVVVEAVSATTASDLADRIFPDRDRGRAEDYVRRGRGVLYPDSGRGVGAMDGGERKAGCRGAPPCRLCPDAEMEPRAMNGLEARADRARQIDRRQISALPRYDGYASAVGGRPDTGRRILKGCM
jgi:hypothetical protein